MAPTKIFLTSSSFYFPLLAQQPTALWPLFPQLFHFQLKRGFPAVLLSFILSSLLLFPRHADGLWPYLPHFWHSPLNNFIFLFFHLFPEAFSTITFSYDSVISCVFLPFRFFFQNQRIYSLVYLNSIFEILTLQYTLTGLYY